MSKLRTTLKKMKRALLVNQRGQSMVELAISLVFLIFLVAGIIDTGRALLTLITIRDAAQEGVIYGSLHPTENAEIERRVRSASTSAFMSDTTNTTVDIAIPAPNVGGACMCKTASPPNRIQITVQTIFKFSMPFFSSATMPLHAVSIGVILNPICSTSSCP